MNRRIQRTVDDAVPAVLGLLIAAERAARPLDVQHVVLAIGAAVADLIGESGEDIRSAAERPANGSNAMI